MDTGLNFQKLFQGFQNTPALWASNTIYNLEQYLTQATTQPFALKSDHKKLRLGKWVEQFVTFQLQQNSKVTILEENLQIKNNKITIGELDLLILENHQPIHLEIVYKFYVYDTSKNYTNSLEHWIGPNRKDSLIFKLNKLKEKQLPLLYHSTTSEALEQYSLDIKTIRQNVCFKAQLFLPFEAQSINIAPLNPACVVGFYLNFETIHRLKDYLFYIPQKLEWLSAPQFSVSWLPFNVAKTKLENDMKNKRSPLCWIKNSADKIDKCFITWW